MRLAISWLDLKLGVRMLLKYPMITVFGGLAMAFAIAVGAATFEFVTGAVHPSIPLQDGDRLVGIRNWDAAGSGAADRALHDLAAWRGLESVEELGAFRTVQRNLSVGGGASEPEEIAEITPSAFGVARVPPLMGRHLVAADGEPGAALVAVIGHRVWQRRFGSDPDVVGRTVRIGGAHATIVGVMPEGFAFPVHHGLWVPLGAAAGDYPPGEGPGVRVFGRLAPGATLTQAQAELTALGRRASADLPATHRHLRPEVLPYGESLFPMRLDSTTVAGAYSINLFLVLFLALVCANVGALVFARTATRESEIVVRSALGASRGRIVMQLFTEALVLGGVAALVGLAAAELGLAWGMDVMAAVNGEVPFWMRRSLSPRTVLYVALLTLLGATLAGVMPALKVTGGMATRLRQAAAGGAGLRFGGVLTGVIVAQVAFTVVFIPIVLDTGLDTRRIRTADVGLPAEEYLSASLRMDRDAPVGVPASTAEEEFRARVDAVYRELEQRLVSDPAVAGATYATSLPGGYHPRRRIEIEDAGGASSSATEQRVQVASVDPGYFRVLERPLLAGRTFANADLAPSARAVVVNRSFARKVLGGRDPIGLRVRYLDTEDEDATARSHAAPAPWYEIVGVVEDVALTVDPDLPHNAGLFHPATPSGAYPIELAVHVRGEPAAFAPRLRAHAGAVDRGLRVHRMRPLDDIRWDALLTYTFWLRITLLGSGVALLLSFAGIYAVMAFVVARRTREIGIRVALGADRRRIVRTIFSRAFAQVGLGIAVGAAVLLLLGAGIPSARYLGLIAAGMGSMAVAGLLACVVPTARALRIQPTEAMKADA